MRLQRIGNKNAVEITKADGTIVLVSYSTPVAALVPGEGFYKTAEKFSVTTSKQITQWLDGANAQVKPQSYFDSLI